MRIHKQYLMSRPVCKVTVRIPGDLANTNSQAVIAGNFNGWSVSTHPMKKLKTGAFMATVDLEAGRKYQFRCALDQQTWESDPEADGLVPTPFGDGHNGVLIT